MDSVLLSPDGCSVQALRCNAPKTADTKEVPPSVAFQVQRSSSNDGAFSGGVDGTSPPLLYANESREGMERSASDESAWDTPSRVLMVRMLPPDIEEGEVRAGYRLVPAVLAFWLAVAHAPLGLMCTPSCFATSTTVPYLQQNDMAADVTALLDNAAAEVMPHFEEPKKRWPLPFETAGGSYVYANESGLYWDPDSMFYYNAQTKLYYSHFTGTYYRCLSAGDGSVATFETFTPPLPIDNAVYGGLTVNLPTANASGLSLSLKKEKKKAPGISFGLKSAVFGSASSVFEQNQPARATSGSVAAPFGTGAGAASVGMKRKSAEDIAKWSQRQREIKTREKDTVTAAEQQRSSQIGAKAGASLTGKGAGAASSAASAVIDALTNAAQQAPICLHEKLSKLHQQNVAKAKENKQHIAAQYREQEEEMTRDLKKLRQQERTMPSPAAVGWDSSSKASSEPAVGSLEAGIGGKMLKMMGWKSGEGLGKHGTGITAPVKAAGSAGRAETAGLGSKASLSASVDLSDATTDKERRQRLARARYEASETSR
ncbi:hypothetical protein BBJ28_00006098 [Nothophytophthora sp. Chile5]|nr:hypothetical protein BBJ28_00006098 [Nothophytophthora sp. Chile5]